MVAGTGPSPQDLAVLLPLGWLLTSFLAGPSCPPGPRVPTHLAPWSSWPLLTLAAAHGLLVLSRAESTYASGLTSDVTSLREAFLTPTPADSQAALPG